MINRRMFLKTLGLSVGFAVLAPVRAVPALAEGRKVAVAIDKVPKLKTIGGWTIVRMKAANVLMVRDAEDSVRAFDPLCTHKSCVLGYNADRRRLDCPCHGSSFDLDGKPQARPATIPLRTYPAVLDGDRIILDLG
jgi:Rieske Fe-S protein